MEYNTKVILATKANTCNFHTLSIQIFQQNLDFIQMCYDIA